MEHWDLTAVAAPDGTRDPVVLFSEEEGRAVLIRLDPSQELREHQVKERAWIWVVEGTARFACDGTTVDAAAGTLLTFAPDERHAVASEQGARLLLLLSPWPGEGHYRGGGGPVGA